MRKVVVLSVLALIGVLAGPAGSAPIHVENASFEAPLVDPNGFGAWPVIDGWIELDLDELGSQNTGVFLNTEEGSPDRVANADGAQLAFLGSQQGNALEQDLEATYEAGCDYWLTVGVCVSALYAPMQDEPADTLELAFYYVDGLDRVDIAVEAASAAGLSSTELLDHSVHLPAVEPNDPWAGKPIGIAIRAAGEAGGFWDLDNVRVRDCRPVVVDVANASFEAPAVDPNGFGAWPVIDEWIELDLDELGSQNTGVFLNTDEGSPDRVGNAVGAQLAFLGSQQGNALEQDLEAIYEGGYDYRLTVGVAVSSRYRPAPTDMLEIALYYLDGPNSVDIAVGEVPAAGLSSTHLQDFSVYLPAAEPNDPWLGSPIGIAIRAIGEAGGFWDLDDVRLLKSQPIAVAVENASFEAPELDPNAFPALPVAPGWRELDNDLEASTNTGVFGNTAPDSWDHINNAQGSQLAFLGTQAGNGFEQDLKAVYRTGFAYRLTVGVGISSRYPPSVAEPADRLELAFYYWDDNDAVVDIARQALTAESLSVGWLTDYSLSLPRVDAEDAWAGKPIGIAIRALGEPGGFWDLDNVRLTESVLEADPGVTIQE